MFSKLAEVLNKNKLAPPLVEGCLTLQLSKAQTKTIKTLKNVFFNEN